MAEEFPIHPFETFPRAELFNGITRRQFFQSLKVEVELFARRSEGFSAMRISALGCLSDEELYDLIPKILPNARITLKDHQVWGCPPGEQKLRFLFDQEERAVLAFNLINGRNTLYRIAQELSDQSSLPFDRAFAFTRGLFLTLVKNRVCLPVNNPLLG